jgi:hypothetical protein
MEMMRDHPLHNRAPQPQPGIQWRNIPNAINWGEDLMAVPVAAPNQNHLELKARLVNYGGRPHWHRGEITIDTIDEMNDRDRAMLERYLDRAVARPRQIGEEF